MLTHTDKALFTSIIEIGITHPPRWSLISTHAVSFFFHLSFCPLYSFRSTLTIRLEEKKMNEDGEVN
jgi:hypothetical protein